MDLRIGTSGFSYKEWKGPFYPDNLKNDEMLSFYASRLSAVEINNTFYRMPRTSMLEQWARAVPPGFHFVLKASRRITHHGRLKDAADGVAYLFKQAEALGDHLGPVLFQLPPNLKKDVPRLEAFLDTVPTGRAIALEFRNPTWYDDEVFRVLEKANAALCIAHFDELEKEVPFVTTARFGYLRLRASEYTDRELEQWAKRILAEDWNTAYVFFKHEDEGVAPALATRLEERARVLLGREPPR